MKSMTGYSVFQEKTENYQLSIEIKAWNHKFLETKFNIPYYLNSVEKNFRDILSGTITRGKLDCSIYFTVYDLDYEVKVNNVLSDRIYEKMDDIRKRYKMKQKIHLGNLLRYDGILSLNQNFDPKGYESMILDKFQDVVKQLEIERIREGEGLKKYFIEEIDFVKKNLDEIKKNQQKEVISYFEYVKQKMNELLSETDIDEKRILEEAAFYSSKYDITEEIKRFEQHLDYFASLLESNEPIGKKIDFLSQEMLRETNTICSKATLFEIKKPAIEIKDSIEKIREQGRNIE